jgi:protocatechuate 3,4-dioxygenase, beta subunit
MPKTPVGRRHVLAGVGAVLIARPVSALAASSPLVVTPGQTEGPFYPVSLPADMDADLVRVHGRQAQSMGRITHVSGRVLDRKGEIVRGAMVEIWQCDARGVYNHPRSPGVSRRDSDFQGYGRTEIDAAGRYAFRTIRPVAYPGRTPHIHFKVHAPGKGRLTTQLYVAGEQQNGTDGVLNAIRNRAARESVIVRLEEAGDIEAGALRGTFDIVLDI